MPEGLWACLLAIALIRRETRPLAFLLGGKWALNYLSTSLGLWLMPALIDIAAGALALTVIRHLPGWRDDAMTFCFVLAALVHGWHWVLYPLGVYVGVQYYWLMLGLFTAQVFILSGPGAWSLVYSGGSRLVVAFRGLVAGLAPAPRGRPGARGRGR